MEDREKIVKTFLMKNQFEEAYNKCLESIIIEGENSQSLVLKVVQAFLIKGERKKAYNLLSEVIKRVEKPNTNIIKLFEQIKPQIPQDLPKIPQVKKTVDISNGNNRKVNKTLQGMATIPFNKDLTIKTEQSPQRIDEAITTIQDKNLSIQLNTKKVDKDELLTLPYSVDELTDKPKSYNTKKDFIAEDTTQETIIDNNLKQLDDDTDKVELPDKTLQKFKKVLTPTSKRPLIKIPVQTSVTKNTPTKSPVKPVQPTKSGIPLPNVQSPPPFTKKKNKFVKELPNVIVQDQIKHDDIVKAKSQRYQPTIQIRVPKKQRKIGKDLILYGILIIVFILSAFGVWYFFNVYKKHQERKLLIQVSYTIKDDLYKSHLKAMDMMDCWALKESSNKIGTFCASEAATLWGRFTYDETFKQIAEKLIKNNRFKDENYYLAQSLVHFYSGEPDLSVKILKNVIHKYFSDVRLNTVLGLSLIYTGKINEGYQLLEKAYAFDDKNFPLVLWLARLSRYMQQYDKAKEYINKGELISSNNFEVKVEKILFELNTIEENPLEDDLQKIKNKIDILKTEAQVGEVPIAIKNKIDFLDGNYYLIAGDYEKSFNLLSKSFERSLCSTEIARVFIESAIVNLRLEIIDHINRKYNNIDEFWLNEEKTKLYMAIGRQFDINELIDKISKENIFGENVGKIKCYSYIQTHDRDKSLSQADLLNEIYKTSDSAYLLGKVYLDYGLARKAMDIFKKIRETQEATCSKARSLYWIDGNINSSLKVLESYVKTNSSNYFCGYDLLGDIFASKADLDNAQIYYQKSLFTNYFPENILNYLRVIIGKNGLTDETIEKMKFIWEKPPTLLYDFIEYMDFLKSIRMSDKIQLMVENSISSGIMENDLSIINAIIEMDAENYPKALNYLSKLPLPRPQIAKIVQCRVLIKMGETKTASAVVDSIDTQPFTPMWRDYLKLKSLIYIQSGDNTSGINLYLEAINNSFKERNLPWVYKLASDEIEYAINIGDKQSTEKGLEIFDKVKNFSPDNYNYYYGLYNESSENNEEAIRNFKICYQINNTNLKCIEKLKRLTGEKEYEDRLIFLTGDNR